MKIINTGKTFYINSHFIIIINLLFSTAKEMKTAKGKKYIYLLFPET